MAQIGHFLRNMGGGILSWDFQFHYGCRPTEEYPVFDLNTYDWATNGPFIDEGYGPMPAIFPVDPPPGRTTYVIIGWGKDRIPHEPDGHCDICGVWAAASHNYEGTISEIEATLYLCPSDVPGGQNAQILINDTIVFSKDGTAFPQGVWADIIVDVDPPVIDPIVTVRHYSSYTCFGAFWVGFAWFKIS